ncbi:DUF1839 family protein [Xylophilus rhododendri]|uniref:DUF1839 family protein n=1 Tax=Xylophilus rhododendri TaxID=2697032 RepID=A0A857J479_9BURK|nr:DUF1839 family protein [Xylophilus rhododendri]QHI98586.1 DUF1839 family protein [Xylophilus rhododendri]
MSAMEQRETAELAQAASARVLPIAAEGYQVHALHREDQAWVQKNCYADVWIEALHALGLQPEAMLAFTVALSFEGDQWTFFKPPHRDLEELYGIEVEELNVWRGNILEHALHHVGEGKLVFTEADAFWMPDTAGTDYREQHTKSTIVINAVDLEQRRLGYFHNAGYFELGGEDFAHLFRLDYPHDPGYMPFFAEFARIDRLRESTPAALVATSIKLLRSHLARLPRENPIERFAARYPADVAWLQREGLSFYHRYAFATLRQLGANFELAASYLAWLSAHGEPGLATAQTAFLEISSGTKALLLKTARAVNTGRQVQFQELLQDMARAWSAGMDCLTRRYG